MIAIISPAKRLDLKSDLTVSTFTIPEDLERSEQLINKLRKTSRKKIGELMGLSQDLTRLNIDRYATWSPDMTLETARQSIFTFDGEVYRGIDIPNLSETDLNYAQDYLAILSGLHGLLRPLDLIKPYRLEMGTKISMGRRKNLYDFWGDRVTDRLNFQLEKTSSDVLINLASSEYTKVINFNKLNARVITPVFMDLKNGEFKVLVVYAKQARGMMSRYIIENKIKAPDELKCFEGGGYRFTESLSVGDKWVFTR